MNLTTIDVSELEQPVSMTNILSALSKLSWGDCLKVVHRREPFPLYDKLREAGWNYLCNKVTENRFYIFIYQYDNNIFLTNNSLKNYESRWSVIFRITTVKPSFSVCIIIFILNKYSQAYE